ncbi:MAG: general secretion pathway protein GspB [Sideroxydans sp.]|nr:general secretion pathway protein GspB [Sideroxyarcus sp.]
MSYILDALRKSEQQRRHGAAPSLLAVQAAAYEASTRPAFPTYGLIAAALIGAGVALGWSHPWQHELPSSVKESSAARPFEPESRTSVFPESAKSGQERAIRKPAAPAAPATGHAVALRQNPPLAAEAQVRPRSSKPSAAIPAETGKTDPEVITAQASTGTIASPRESSIEPPPASASQERKLVAMRELPLAIQQEIPAISIQGHAYSSDPQDRVVGINDRLLKEGEYAAPGLRLEQITPDGLVFSYRNYLFRRGL